MTASYQLPIIRICTITAARHFKLKSASCFACQAGTSFSSRSHGASHFPSRIHHSSHGIVVGGSRAIIRLANSFSGR